MLQNRSACLFALLSASLLPLCVEAIAEQDSFDPNRFEPTVLANGLLRPMELEVANDGTIFFIELAGHIKAIDPRTHAVRQVGQVQVTTEQENGLIGFALDPDFATNHWLYLQYSPPDFSGQHISRFTLMDGVLDLASEKLLFKYEEQRKQCCHHAGALQFGPNGDHQTLKTSE